MYININVIWGKEKLSKVDQKVKFLFNFLCLIQKMKELHYNVYENWHMILKITAITIDVL